MKTRLVARAAAAIVAAASMLGIGGVVANSAMAEDTTFTPAAGTITIFAPKTPDPNTTNMVPPTINGREFKAYKLASYSDVQTKDTDSSHVITGMNLTTTLTNADLDSWIRSAVVNDGRVDSGFPVALDSDGSISFTGDAANLTPIQFVAKYFYGTKADRYGNDNADSTAMRLFAQAAAQSGKLTAAETVTGKDGKAEFTGLDEGLYLIAETDTAPTDETLARAMITGTPYTKTENGSTITYTSFDGGNHQKDSAVTLGVLYLKAEKVEVTKSIPAGDQLVKVGSIRQYEIDTHVPMYSDYLSWVAPGPTFAISDAPSSNLKVLNDATHKITVTANDGTVLTAGTDYTLDTSTPANGFTVTLKDPKSLSGQKIVVTYSAEVMSVVEDTIHNTATVDFSNDPSTTTGGKVDTEKPVNLYVTRVPIEKIAYGNKSTLLPGATFSVVDKADSTKTPLSFIYDSSKNIYSVVPAGTANAVTEITVNDASKNTAVSVAGLGGDSSEASTYTFTETKAPDGYILGSTPVSFTLTVTPKASATDAKTIESVAFKETPTANFGQFLDESDADISSGNSVSLQNSDSSTDGTTTTTTFVSSTIRVENTKNADDFAKTGGEIVRVIIAVAVLMAIGAAFLIASHLRRRSLSR